MDEREAFEAGYNAAVEKVKDWLRKNIEYNNSEEYPDWYVNFCDNEDMIDEFEKYMSSGSH